MNDDAALEARVIAVIAQTFSVPSAAITRATIADDVDGWDSLGHSILMIRLSNALGMPIGEDIAANAGDVGQLVDMLALERSHRA